MATLNIIVKTNSADAREYTASGHPQRCIGNAASLLKGLAAGIDRGEVTVQRSDADPVAASGTWTLVSVIATDTVTVGKTTFTGTDTPTTTLHFDTSSEDDEEIAASIAAAVNAHADTSLIVRATAAGAVVTVTALQKGVVGNQIAFTDGDSTITSSGSGYLAGGAGGSDGTVTTYGR